MADNDDPVQPEGQGGEVEGNPLYSEYLTRIQDDEARSIAEEGFKAFDANTTKRFQEAAEQRRELEPYEQYVKGRDQAEVEWAMQFVDALRNPTAIQEWFTGYAQEHGLAAAQQAAAEQGVDEYIDPHVQTLDQQQKALASQLAEITQWRESQEQARVEAEFQTQIRTELDAIKAKHPDEFDESLVDKLLPQYIQSDPQHAVQRAWADAQALVAQVQKQWVDAKASQPAGAVSGGSASGTADPPPKGQALKFASQQALAQLRGTNST